MLKKSDIEKYIKKEMLEDKTCDIDFLRKNVYEQLVESRNEMEYLRSMINYDNSEVATDSDSDYLDCNVEETEKMVDVLNMSSERVKELEDLLILFERLKKNGESVDQYFEKGVI